MAILDKRRYRDPSFVALARAALKTVAGERIEAIMTGMPAAWFADKAAQEQLRAALAHAAAPWGTPEITIAPEAAGLGSGAFEHDERYQPAGLALVAGVEWEKLYE
ncbi:MAG: hypothetical protein H7Y32_19200, partial [Chloroflexales bacterium]|nr:hypothetical protein [Chloroflexales bacterium]